MIGRIQIKNVEQMCNFLLQDEKSYSRCELFNGCEVFHVTQATTFHCPLTFIIARYIAAGGIYNTGIVMYSSDRYFSSKTVRFHS